MVCHGGSRFSESRTLLSLRDISPVRGITPALRIFLVPVCDFLALSCCIVSPSGFCFRQNPPPSSEGGTAAVCFSEYKRHKKPASDSLSHKSAVLYPSPILIGYSAAVCLLWNCPRSTLLLEKINTFSKYRLSFLLKFVNTFLAFWELELKMRNYFCIG